MPNPQPTTNNRQRTKDQFFRVFLQAGFLVLIAAAVYWPVHRFGLIDYDDPEYLYANPHIRQGLTMAGLKDAFCDFQYANYDPPLVTLSYELDQNLFGLKPGLMHIENVLLHLLTTILLWRLLFAATGELNFSFTVAAIFLCHPMHVESVAWISERKDVLSTPVLIAAMLAYVRFCKSPSGKKRWFIYAIMLALFTLSLLAKAMGITLPAILLLLDYWPLRRWPAKSWSRLVIEKIPLVLITAMFSAIQYFAQTQIGAPSTLTALSLMERINNAIVCYTIYIVKLAVPTGLAVFYPHPGARPMTAVIAAAGLLIFISLICWRLRDRKPFLIVGWLWFVGTLLPVIGLVQIGSQAMADRYSYLPSVGLSIVVIWGVAEVVRSTIFRSILVVSLIAVFSVIAHRQVLYWENTQTLFTHASEVTDDNAVAYVELGNVAFQRRDIHQAMDNYKSAGDDPHAYSGLGNCWLPDDRKKAISYYRKALTLRPKSPAYLIQLAIALRMNGDLNEANQLVISALKIDPSDSAGQAELAKIDAERAKKNSL